MSAVIEGMKIGFGTYDDGKRGAEMTISISGVVFDENNPIAAAVIIANTILEQQSTIRVGEVQHPAQADGDSATDDLLARLRQRMSEGN